MTVEIHRKLLCLLILSLAFISCEKSGPKNEMPQGRVEGQPISSTNSGEMEIQPGEKQAMNYINCGSGGPITSFLTVTDEGAGHAHSNPGRPTGSVNPVSFTIPCDGHWHYGTTFTAPEVSGVVILTSYIKGVAFYTMKFVVKVHGLVPLPASPYIVPVGTDLEDATDTFFGCVSQHHHPINHWGQPELVQKTLELAQKYFFRRTKKLLVNDMSLPWGGTLDFCDNWSSPHQTHRDGRHVDIQMKGAMSLDDKVAFRSIAESIFGKQHVCIDGGTHWHLVIGTTCTDSASLD